MSNRIVEQRREDPVTLEIFKNLFASVAEEMGVTLQRTAYSPNIKERLDFSCAVFDGQGRMVAQAAHIPVHLGAMPKSVRQAIELFERWQPGDVVILNDPYLGGTHLPDITMVSPVFIETPTKETLKVSETFRVSFPAFFVASRAHHADMGGISPGSMPLATEIYQEGIIIPPLKIADAGQLNEALMALICRNVRTPEERRGDLAAQMAAHRVGERRLKEIVARYGGDETMHYAGALLVYSERLTRRAIAAIPDGCYTFSDCLDDDGIVDEAVEIRVAVTVAGEEVVVDFTGSSPQVRGNLNAVLAVTQSAVYYVVRCVAGGDVPANHGCFAPVTVIAPSGSVLNPRPPGAVAGGNVETSQRVVDVVLGALAQALPGLIPAASQGTMNNLTIGGYDPVRRREFAYYETVGGGIGAGPKGEGLSGAHSHMSNTRNTPIEALEYAFPFRVRTYALRRGSGGQGQNRGGDGLRRDIEFLSSATVTILSERRRLEPYGLNGGEPGQRGRNVLLRDGTEKELPGKVTLSVRAGDVLSLRTPGGGGWGEPEPSAKTTGRSSLSENHTTVRG